MDIKFNQIFVFVFLILITVTNSCKNKIYENAEIILLSGDNQIGDANNLLDEPIVIRITNNETYESVEEIEVICEVAEGSVDHEITHTDSYGKAQINWTLGNTVGDQILTISVTNKDNIHIDGSPIIVRAIANSVPSSVNFISGNNQTGQIGTKLLEPLSFNIKDHNDDNYIGKIYLSIDGDGKIPDTCLTDSEGIIGIHWMLGMSEGEQTATISFFDEDRTTHLEGSPISINATGTPLVSVTDIDGNTYNVIKIGEQYWIKENLKVTRYADGTEIPLFESNSDWGNLGYLDKGCCFYNNDEDNIYGAYYTRAAALNGGQEVYSSENPSNIQGVCPDGWHVPSQAEFSELSEFLGGSNVAGGKLKSADTIYWLNPNIGATNESGFTALGGGYRDYQNGNFSFMRWRGFWWSTTFHMETGGFPILLMLESNYDDLSYYGNYQSSGNNVRCVKDME